MGEALDEMVLYAADYASVPTIRCSPPSWMVHLLLVEKGVHHRVRWLDFARGEHRTDEIRRLSPRGTIPILTEGPAILTETLAILEYVECRTADRPWMPEDRVGRARALSRLHEAAAVKDQGMALFRALMRGAASDEDWDRLRTELSRWDGYLADAPWLSGERIGLADLCVFTYLATAVHLGLSFDGWPRLREYHARMRQRPAVTATWPATLGS